MDLLCEANCSHDKIELRSAVDIDRVFSRKNGESSSGRVDDKYDILDRVVNVEREGVCGSGSSLRKDARIRGRAGVGAVGDTILDSMSSTSCASMLSMLLSSVRMIGVALMSDDDARIGDGLEFCAFLRATTSASGESCCEENMLLSGLRL